MMEQEVSLKQRVPNLAKDQAARNKAALERQIRRQIRLLLQLKANRSQRGSRPETNADAAPAPLAGPASSPFSGACSDPSSGASSGTNAEPIATNGPATGPKGEELVVSRAPIAEKREKWSNEPSQAMYNQALDP